MVGAALALGLAAQGCTVAIVECAAPRTQRTADDARGLALGLSSQQLLRYLAVWDALAAAAYPIKYVHVTQRGHFGAVRLRHTELGVPALGYVCSAAHVHQALTEAVCSQSMITQCWSSRIANFTPDETGGRLSVHTPHGRHECSTRLVIGADGSESQVRELLGIRATRHDYGQTAIVANVDVEFPVPHTAYERLTATGPCAVLPLDGRRQVVIRTALSAEIPTLLKQTDDAYLAGLEARFGPSLGRFSRLGARQAHPLIAQRATTLTAPRGVLIGNAANTVHPNGAQGLNLGLRDVATLLSCINKAKADGADLGGAELLASYASARRADHRLTTGFSDLLARTFALELPAFGSARAAAMVVADRLPWLKRTLLRRLTGNTAWA